MAELSESGRMFDITALDEGEFDQDIEAVLKDTDIEKLDVWAVLDVVFVEDVSLGRIMASILFIRAAAAKAKLMNKHYLHDELLMSLEKYMARARIIDWVDCH